MSAENETSLSKQLLEITKQMLTTGKPFSIRLSMPCFNYSASSQIKETPDQDAKQKKYKSPSQRNRDSLRKEKFLKQKLNPPTGPAAQAKDEDSVDFKCDQCNYVSTTDKGLQIHIGKKHKISQIDGVVDFLEEHKQTQTDVFSDYEEIPFKIDHEADDAARVIEAKLKPPKYVEDSKYGLGILSSFDDGVICYKFKCQNAQNKEDYFENEVLTYKITLPNI